MGITTEIEKKLHPEWYCPYLNCLWKTAETSPNGKNVVLNPGFCPNHARYAARSYRAFLAFVAVLLLAFSASAQVAEESYGPLRNASTNTETTLTVANVGSAAFGQLFSYPVDNMVYAQPLYVPGVNIPGIGTRNVVYVVTMSNSVFALDADVGQLLWSVNLGTNVTDQPALPSVGITSTPYIANGIMYVVADVSVGGVDTYYLHALDSTTGKDTIPAVVIAGSSNGVTFNAALQLQRPGLAVANGNVIIAFGSYDDTGPYHGWVFAYNETLQKVAALCVTPATGGNGGIWMSGRAPVVDAVGDIYFEVGNGLYDGVSNFGESFLKLSSTLIVEDWFTPSPWSAWNGVDEDLGSSGPLLIPGTSALLGGGKSGTLYLLNAYNMGKEAATDQTVQEVPSGYSGYGYFNESIFSGGAFLNGVYYIWANGMPLKAYQFDGAKLVLPPMQSALVSPQEAFGPAIAVSSNGGLPGTTIVWASSPLNSAEQITALDAATLSTIWSANLSSAWSKWRPPVVANGKVYIASTALTAYGLVVCQPETVTVYFPLTGGTSPAAPSIEFFVAVN